MKLHAKLSQWQEHRVIDAATARAIAQFEESQPRMSDHLWRYGLVGLATLCVGLGLLLIIASNWQSIPFSIKLGTHTLLNIALGAWLYRHVRADNSDSRPSIWPREIPLLVLAFGQLSLMALIGQYFQLSSPIKDVMLFWLVLIAPMLLLLGRSFFSAILLMGLSLYLIAAQFDLKPADIFLPVMIGSIALHLLSLRPDLIAARPGWASVMRNTAIFGSCAFVFLFFIDPSFFYRSSIDWSLLLRLNPVLGLIGAALYAFALLKKPHTLHLDEHPARSALLCWNVFFLSALLFTPFSLNDHVNTVSFCLYGFGMAYIGYRHQHNKMLSFGILLIALRLIVYFMQLMNNFLLGGIGMIAIGGFTLLILKRVLRKTSHTAPSNKEAIKEIPHA